ncbi:hypothetical protein BVRB_1g013380 [Beta vulgaris subsp. vulgaris]|nr:hypothetical protein BVRB_1g013380 [Beta vulgaris subsp. vulgaris]
MYFNPNTNLLSASLFLLFNTTSNRRKPDHHRTITEPRHPPRQTETANPPSPSQPVVAVLLCPSLSPSHPRSALTPPEFSLA